MTLASGMITLTAKTYYYIRILYGDGDAPYEMSTSFKTPMEIKYHNENGFYMTTLPGM